MKRLVHKVLFACAVLIGFGMHPTKSAFAETATAPVIALPLTNNSVFIMTNVLGFTNTPPGGFTNTLVQPTNLANLRLTNIVILLLRLQTNIEETLPILVALTSNASVTVPSANAQGAVVPITSLPPGLFLTPTGRTNGAQQPTVISMTLGTNVIEIDPATFQALVLLQNDLELTLPVLQSLNGTEPRATNAAIPGTPTTPLTNSFFPTANVGFAPLTTTGLVAPLTNQPQQLTTPSPF